MATLENTSKPTRKTPETSCSEAGVPTEDTAKRLLQHRKILVNQDIDDSLIEKAVMQIELFNWEDDDREDSEVGYARTSNPITVYINSDGGYCTSGLALISAIEQSRTPVVTVAMGKAYSMGFMILIAGHVRLAYRHAELMYHQVSYGHFGDHTDSVRRSNKAEELLQRLESIVKRRTRIPARMLKQAREQRLDLYMFPEEAMELGVLDGVYPQEIIAPRPPKRTSAAGKGGAKEAGDGDR